MGLFGSGADLATDLLLLGEIVISALVFAGTLAIKRGRHVARHRKLMLWAMALNAAFLVAFLVYDSIRAQTLLDRAKPGPLFFFTLGVHLGIAVTAMGVAIVSWRIARKGIIGRGDAIDLEIQTRTAHRRVSRWYPWAWGFTLATGIALYTVVYAGA